MPATRTHIRLPGRPYSENNFGLIEIEWLEEGANVLLKTIGLDGCTAFKFAVNLDELRPNT